MRTAAVIAAAGSGSRLGRTEPKALVRLGGDPLVVHAARRLLASGCVDEIVVAAPADQITATTEALAGLDGPIVVIAGGATRQQSVAAGLAGLSDDVTHVLIHDAARALTPPALIRAVVEALAAGHPAVVPGLPVADTIRSVVPGEPTVTNGLVDRDTLRAIQTPQGFSRGAIERAHRAAVRAGFEATDDAELVAELGIAVVLIDGDEAARKITTATDLALAEVLLAGEDRNP